MNHWNFIWKEEERYMYNVQRKIRTTGLHSFAQKDIQVDLTIWSTAQKNEDLVQDFFFSI